LAYEEVSYFFCNILDLTNIPSKQMT
jgi:hypothetical protein